MSIIRKYILIFLALIMIVISLGFWFYSYISIEKKEPVKTEESVFIKKQITKEDALKMMPIKEASEELDQKIKEKLANLPCSEKGQTMAVGYFKIIGNDFVIVASRVGDEGTKIGLNPATIYLNAYVGADGELIFQKEITAIVLEKNRDAAVIYYSKEENEDLIAALVKQIITVKSD